MKSKTYSRQKNIIDNQGSSPSSKEEILHSGDLGLLDNEATKEKYRYYREERKLFIEAERDIAKMFDQLLLAVASGVLTLSVSNAEKIMKAGYWKLGLGMAWLLLVLTSLCTLLSLLFSQHNWKISRENLDIEQNYTEYTEEICDNAKRLITGVTLLNWAGLFSFIIALIIIAAVAYKNLI